MNIKNIGRFGKTMIVASIMLVSVAGSAFAEEVKVFGTTVNGQEVSSDSSVKVYANPVKPVVVNSTDNNISVTGENGTLNQKKKVTVYRNYPVGDDIPGSIVYTEDHGTDGRWGGTLSMTNIKQNGGSVTVTYEGWVYKDFA